MLHYLIWASVSILYAPTIHTLYTSRWDSIDYTHAFFILPIALWLVWRDRKKINEIYQQTDLNSKSIFSFIVIIFGILLFIFGHRQDYYSISSFSIVPLLFGLTTYLYGTRMARALSFPILYLLLFVPPPLGILDSITLPMRYGISAAAEIILQALSYPISREGLLLTIGYNDIFMGQPCSGFRSLITMISLVMVYVYITKGTLSKKLILAAFIIPLALVGNLVRVITLCLITFYFGEEAGQGFFHNFSGILIFIITILGLMGVETVIDKQHPVDNK